MGSEMCIRDRPHTPRRPFRWECPKQPASLLTGFGLSGRVRCERTLLCPGYNLTVVRAGQGGDQGCRWSPGEAPDSALDSGQTSRAKGLNSARRR